MKRPVTSLCRRPEKKDRLRAVCPRCGNNFRPQGRSVAGRQICRAKAAWMRAQKQPPARAGDCAQAAPMGEWQAMGAGKAPHWAPAGAEGIPGAKTAPGGGRGLCAGCAMGGTAGNEGVWCRESTALGARWDRGTPGRKNSPRRAPEAVWMRDMGVTCPGRSV